jgi:gas vesicle protein
MQNNFTMNYKKAISDRFQSKTRNTSASTVALALVGGIALGAIVSLLFAPQKGEDTRNMIADKTRDLTDGVKEKFRAIRHKAQSHGKEMADQMNSKYNSVKNGVSSES